VIALIDLIELEDNVSYAFEAVRKKLNQIGHVILIGSGKGGVGKSMIASAIAVTLSKQGHRTGLLDIDVHGASIPNYLDLKPPLRSSEKGLEPKMLGWLRVMSVAFFAGKNPVPIRGVEKEDLISQLMALTNWGELDYLVVDLPPGMGDEVLSAFSLFSTKCRLILVTTPSQHAYSVVSLMCKLAERERIPLAGVVVNMSYMLIQRRKIYPLGRVNRGSLEKAIGARIITEVPLEPRINDGHFQEILKENNELTKAIGNLTLKLLKP
jgi:ATP-binding protein involved in chromosome partitioning